MIKLLRRTSLKSLVFVVVIFSPLVDAEGGQPPKRSFSQNQTATQVKESIEKMIKDQDQLENESAVVVEGEEYAE